MKICIAQTRPVTGDIARNIDHHQKFIELALAHGAGLIFFPELSLTGYEPALAQELATTPDDPRLDLFQNISDTRQITIGLGLPTRHPAGICISMVLFQPDQARQTYSKKYIHADEAPFFISGQNFTGIKSDQANIALAICYELSIPDHAENAFQSGANIYVASVAKFVNGVDKAMRRLSEIARNYAMTVFMSNCIGPADGAKCAGGSAIWNSEGVLIGQLNDTNEGILIFDPDRQALIEQTI